MSKQASYFLLFILVLIGNASMVNTSDAQVAESDSYIPVLLDTTYYGELANLDSEYYSVTGADTVELQSLTGISGLNVYLTQNRNEPVCTAQSTRATQSCHWIDTGEAVVIQVFASNDTSYSITASNTNRTKPLVNNNTERHAITESEREFFVISDAGGIHIQTITGFTDLNVYSDVSLAASDIVCSFRTLGSRALSSYCDIPDTGEYYAAVRGVSDSTYEIRSYAASGDSDCIDTPPFNNGWGWNGTESCRIVEPQNNTPGTHACVDYDGDGWGWNGISSCIPTSSGSDATSTVCIDTNPIGDGWGWDGNKSCRVTG